MGDVLRRMSRSGLDPLEAIRCATINNASRLRRDDLGMLAAGRRADVVVLADVADIEVAAVYVNGRHVAGNGAMLETPAARLVPPAAARRKPHPPTAGGVPLPVGGRTTGAAVRATPKGAPSHDRGAVA